MSKLDEIAARINAHLRRLEADKDWNRADNGGRSRLYLARARRAGRYIQIIYISYQGASNLIREDAERYLQALDSGKKCKHWHIGVAE